MVVDMNFDSAFEKLKLDDPIWLPAKSWESIKSESGFPNSNMDLPQQRQCNAYTISEACLVRLAMNAMYGFQSALVSIEKITAAFCAEAADRTFHRIPNLWNRCLSTNALGKLLKCIGHSGSVVFLLREFVGYFRNLNLDCNEFGNTQVNSEKVINQSDCSGDIDEIMPPTKSLVNQAFAVAVGKVLEGYISALDTLYASVALRHLAKSVSASSELGCLTNVHSEITLLELYLHTRELMTHIQAIGNICNLSHIALCFPEYSPEDLVNKAKEEFHNFPRGGGLLTFLYNQLQVADPPQHSLLQFVFLRACEPYCEFIRRWIFKAEINDPYKEFIVDTNSHGNAGISFDFPVAIVKVRHDTDLPSFLKDFISPLIRAGQQLQVLKKLLELCDGITIGVHKYEDILPWSVFASNHPCFSSPLIFDNGSIDDLVLARRDFYKTLWQKLDSSVAKLKVMDQQVVPVGMKYGLAKNIIITTVPDSFPLVDCFITPSPDSMGNSYTDFYSVDYGKPDAAKEIADLDPLEFSDFSSSSISSEEENGEMLVIDPAIGLDQLEEKYFAALEFSPSICIDSSRKKSIHNEKSKSLESNIWKTCHGFNDPISPNGRYQCKGNCHDKFYSTFELGKPDLSDMAGKQYEYCLPVVCWPLGGLLKNPFVVDNEFKDAEMLNPFELFMKAGDEKMETLNECSSMLSKIIASGNPANETCYSSWLGSRKPQFQDNFLGMNPMLSKNVLFQFLLKPAFKTSEIFKSGQTENMSFFDFTLVQDPCKVYLDNSSATFENHARDELHISVPSASPTCNLHNSPDRRSFCGDVLSPDSIEHNSGSEISPNIADRSNWEGLLTKSSHAVNHSVGHSSQSVLAMFEMPIDMVIDKCFLQEILLQYKYISKLTLKLLEEGFKLQEHLLAMRRYHFMELADWADLFITSLQHHKWHIMGDDEKELKIQGLLNSTLERSSCGIDHYKDRLYVYNKGHGIIPPGSSIGIHSLDFIGLGYIVDWPINIVLTPGALKIYSDIFGYLMQIKLAAISLADVWRSLKELTLLQNQNQQPGIHKPEMCHFDILIKLRHQLNHFVSTLHQYVQSQLSHVSWFKFLNSPKNKVNDVLDLVSVHMAYLNNAMHICFLSKETQCAGSIIKNILQCALDFRSCILPDGHLSQINISQIVEVGERFDKNLKEVHAWYMKSCKHEEGREFDVSCFWECLNYNYYYSQNLQFLALKTLKKRS